MGPGSSAGRWSPDPPQDVVTTANARTTPRSLKPVLPESDLRLHYISTRTPDLHVMARAAGAYRGGMGDLAQSLRRVLSGDRDAYSEIVADYQDMLLAYA